MAYPIPLNPQWPAKNIVEFPETRKYSIIHKTDSIWTQIRKWLFMRPRFLFTHDYYQYSPMLNAWIFIPGNFVFDGASIPKVFGFMLRPTGILFYGASAHDFGYRFGGLMLSGGEMSEGYNLPYTWVTLSKKTIDDLFEDLNDQAHGLAVVNSVAAWSVTTFAPFNPVDIHSADWSKPVTRESVRG